MQKLLINKFDMTKRNMRVLRDDSHDAGAQPTQANILAAFDWLVRGARSGDSLVFHYSGHGGIQKDASDSSGYAEYMVPVDKKSILDVIVHKHLCTHLPASARLTAIFDCCHRCVSSLDQDRARANNTIAVRR